MLKVYYTFSISKVTFLTKDSISVCGLHPSILSAFSNDPFEYRVVSFATYPLSKGCEPSNISGYLSQSSLAGL